MTKINKTTIKKMFNDTRIRILDMTATKAISTKTANGLLVKLQPHQATIKSINSKLDAFKTSGVTTTKALNNKKKQNRKPAAKEQRYLYHVMAALYFVWDGEERNLDGRARITKIEGQAYIVKRREGTMNVRKGFWDRYDTYKVYDNSQQTNKELVETLEKHSTGILLNGYPPSKIAFTRARTEEREPEQPNDADDFEGMTDELDILRKASTTHAFISNKFISNRIRINGGEIATALEQNEPNECVINAIVNTFAGMSTYNITRDKVIQAIGLTEDDIKDGISINEMKPFFEKYNFTAKIYDSYHRLIYSHEGNKKYRRLYALAKDTHLYLMDHETHKISYYPEYNAEKDEMLKVSANFNLKNEHKIPDNKYEIITSFSDLITYAIGLEKDGKKEGVHHLMLKGPSMYALYIESRDANYDPIPYFKGADIVKLYYRIDGINLIVHSLESMMLVPDVPDDVPDIDYTYLQEFATSYHLLQARIMSIKTISTYDEDDIKILCSAYTRPQSFLLNDIEDKNIIEIDRRKSYRSILEKMDKVPVFNMFDNWTHYDRHDIEDYTLYYVTGVQNNFFLNTYNMCYGMFIKHFSGVKILAFKRPSNIVSVNYAEIIKEFTNCKFSNDESKDMSIKKQAVNVVIGQLQMARNKRSTCKIFESKQDAIKAKMIYGGKVEELQEGVEELIEKIENKYSPLDDNTEDQQEVQTHAIEKVQHLKEDGAKFYVHSIS
eukprot:PhM_4_TR4499/c0_g2_i1/m.21907